ncbi:MAG: BTAD domain-containing putative transcriptional regulator [Chloroflexota bacterium]
MLHIKTFGTLSITHHNQPLTSQLSAKGKALLVYLACHRGDAPERTHIQTLLWSDSDAPRAANSLRQALKQIRLTSLADYILTTRKTVAFNREMPYALDVDRLDDDLSVYDGPFLQGLDLPNANIWEEWLYTQRELFELQVLTQLDSRVADALQANQLDGALRDAQRVLALNPWRENTHRQLMEIHMQMDNPAEAIAQYGICQQVLRDELSIDPSPETTALYERLLHMPTQAERHNLPTSGQLTRFFGRRQELTDIEGRLRQPDCQLLSLLGMGGIGKTRLAIEVGQRLEHRFANGVWLVSLENVMSGGAMSGGAMSGGKSAAEPAHGLWTTIASAFHLTLNPQVTPMAQLSAYLADKELLLILDNFEQLVDEARHLVTLLAAAPQLKCLVTSRVRLGIQMEWEYALEGLPYDDPSQGKPTRENSAAIQLFTYSAQRIRNDFQLTAEDASAVQQICGLVGGLPLGIELAAAWTRLLSPNEILHEIVQDLEMLQTHMRDVPDRQRSLQAILAASWGMLTVPERQILNQLSVFPGDFDRKAASAVAGASLFQFLTLIDKSLLRTVASERYALHPLVRQYAAEQLDASGQLDATRDRHMRHFAQILAEEPLFYHLSITPERLRLLRREHSNVLLAWAWIIERGKVATLLDAYDGLFWTIENTLVGNERVQMLFQSSLMMVRTVDNPLALARLLNGYSILLLANSDFADYTQISDELFTVLDRIEVTMRSEARAIWAEQALCQQMRTVITLNFGDFGSTKAQVQQAVDLWEKAGYTLFAANARLILATAEMFLGDFTQLRTHCDIYLAIRDKRPAMMMTQSSDVLPLLVGLLDALGDYETSHQLLREMITEPAVKNHYLYMPLLAQAGYNAYLRGDTPTARQWLQQSITTMRTWENDLWNLAWGLSHLGEVELADGNVQLAYDYCVEALNGFRAIELQWCICWTLSRLGRTQLVLQQLEGASESFAEAEAIAELLGSIPLQLYAQLGRAQLMLETESDNDSEAIQLVGFVAEHSSVMYYHRVEAERVLAKIKTDRRCPQTT